MSLRLFPIMYDGPHPNGRADMHQRQRRFVPWAMLAPHEDRAESNHGQTLEVLASRGGLGPHEALCILDGKRWSQGREYGSETDAMAELERRVAQFKGPTP